MDATNKKRRKRTAYLDWTIKTSELIGKLSASLAESIETWRTFSSGGVGCFYAPNQPLNIAEQHEGTLVAAVKNFKELDCLLKSLNDFNELLKGDIQTVSDSPCMISMPIGLGVEAPPADIWGLYSCNYS